MLVVMKRPTFTIIRNTSPKRQKFIFKNNQQYFPNSAMKATPSTILNDISSDICLEAINHRHIHHAICPSTFAKKRTVRYDRSFHIRFRLAEKGCSCTLDPTRDWPWRKNNLEEDIYTSVRLNSNPIQRAVAYISEPVLTAMLRWSILLINTRDRSPSYERTPLGISIVSHLSFVWRVLRESKDTRDFDFSFPPSTYRHKERKKEGRGRKKETRIPLLVYGSPPIGQEPEESRSQSISVRGRGGSLINLGSSHAALPLRKPCHPVTMGGDWQS